MVDIVVFLAVELPFWIPIKSGTYTIRGNQELKLRNDYWLVSIANMVDGPFDIPNEYILNENQIVDQEYLEQITHGRAMYYHKQKLKTTFTRAIQITPAPGRIESQPLSEDWWHEVHSVIWRLVEVEAFETFLDDINFFIELLCTTVGTSNPISELRRISYFDTMLRVLVKIRTDDLSIRYLTRSVPDVQRIDQPFPFYRVRSKDDLNHFKETIQSSNIPKFHQVQWIKALNSLREKRYQEALLNADLVLEALTYRYLAIKGHSRRQIQRILQKKKGLANWVKGLNFPAINDELQNVALLRKLRNKVVHEQKVLQVDDNSVIKLGIEGLRSLRKKFLHESDPEIIRLEQQFDSFLVPVPIGRATSESIGRMVEVRIEWRREQDCYDRPYRRE